MCHMLLNRRFMLMILPCQSITKMPLPVDSSVARSCDSVCSSASSTWRSF
ncbi:MAG: hypothetical protein ACD_10C00871G0004 [uncultured bacterium]|nr:MAG: hypothetical protein ACD_10C00871G0004 [uncultured bacterium]